MSTVIAFLARAVAFYTRYGITVEQLLTDNGGGAYKLDRRGSGKCR